MPYNIMKNNLFRCSEIAEMLKIHRNTVAYRVKMLEIVPVEKYFFDTHQIELIKDFELTPRIKYQIFESKMNYEKV